ncbi:hypothetical protein [Pseudobacteroides cellulosolvens]|uniref:Antibiotic biosynthesis monooxygenase n=1 Tax=Pseudobacteroides cellulosolvens ATCC 35603 = DSM 2933 TaxID=398512 RepID=A0A0L6JVH0_9FIRM|nr:hypothetical protein [Pseudobacteroides cellulosolvens]KNY29432.1 hypothetical protein Bccel_4706 [Pseudobacteroides cellulosolvens ATCC 35603 = DSM 2933]
MSCNAPLYNVNEINVQPGLENSYAKFSHKLNEYLKAKYGEYYIGLELYKNKKKSTKFFVVASYKDKRGIENAAEVIGDDIRRIYDKVWGDKVKRTSIFAFVDYTRLIPPQKNR